MQSSISFTAIALSVLILSGCDSNDPGDINGVDVRGRWVLVVAHQDMDESQLSYEFQLTENAAHEFDALADRIILTAFVWPEPVIVRGRVSFEGERMRLDFTFPDDAAPTEHATGRVILRDGLFPGVTDLHYSGAIEGPLLKSPDPSPFDSDNVRMEYIAE